MKLKLIVVNKCKRKNFKHERDTCEREGAKERQLGKLTEIEEQS